MQKAPRTVLGPRWQLSLPLQHAVSRDCRAFPRSAVIFWKMLPFYQFLKCVFLEGPLPPCPLPGASPVSTSATAVSVTGGFTYKQWNSHGSHEPSPPMSQMEKRRHRGLGHLPRRLGSGPAVCACPHPLHCTASLAGFCSPQQRSDRGVLNTALLLHRAAGSPRLSCVSPGPWVPQRDGAWDRADVQD